MAYTCSFCNFDRSGLVASEEINIQQDTVKFMRYFLAAFCLAPSELGYPCGPSAPYHKKDADGQLRQVVTVDGRELFLGHQETGPSRDRLVKARRSLLEQSWLRQNKASRAIGIGAIRVAGRKALEFMKDSIFSSSKTSEMLSQCSHTVSLR